MKIGWTRTMPAALAVLAMTAAACGGSSNNNSTAAGGGGASSSSGGGGGGGSALKVVSDLPLQGASGAQSKTLVQAEQLYLQQQGGKAGKYSVTFQSVDDSTAAAAKWDPTQCQANATKYAADKSLAVVLGTFNSGCADIEIPILGAVPIAMVSPANTAVGLTHVGPGSAPGEPDKYYPTGVRNYARVVSSDDFQGAAAAQLMKELGTKKVYILNDKEIYGKGVADATAAAAKKLGITVLGNEGYDPKSPNYEALFNKIKGTSPDAVFFGCIIDNNGGQLTKDKVKVLGDNTKVKLIAPDGMFVNDFVTQKGAGPAGEGTYFTFAGLGPDQIKARGGSAAKFLQAYEAKYGKPEVYTAYGAAAMQAALAAIAASDGTQKGIVDQVLKVKISKGDSLLGEGYSFDKNGDTTLKDMSIFKAKGNDIPFDHAIAVDASLLK
jgi:branched-chain amino acid transport system substrate-binding protein